MRSTQSCFLLQGSSVSALCGAYQGLPYATEFRKSAPAPMMLQIDIAKSRKFPLCSGR